MTINLGHSLCRPGESNYALVRRVLIANPWLSRNNFRESNLPSYNDHKKAKRTNRNLSLCELIINYCQPSSRISKDIGSSFYYKSLNQRCIKNCPQCARTGYHSLIFNLPWVKICPIHKVHLTTRCIYCGNCWPPLSGLLSNSCPGCGFRISIEELFNNNAFSVDPICTSIEKLIKILLRFDTFDKKFIGYFHNGWVGSKEWVSIRNFIDVNSEYYPSLLCTADPRHEILLRKLEIPIPKITKFPLNLTRVNRDNIGRYSNIGYQKWEIDVIRSTVRKLSSLINESLGVNHRIHHDIGSIDIENHRFCSVCSAFSMWYSLIINAEREIGKPSYKKGSRFYQRIYASELPEAPPSRLYLSSLTDSLASGSPGFYKISNTARTPIYQAYLWNLFIQIYQFTDTIYKLIEVHRNITNAVFPNEIHIERDPDIGIAMTREYETYIVIPNPINKIPYFRTDRDATDRYECYLHKEEG